MRALLIATYEMGRQPFGLASPAAWLRAAGWDVVCADLSRDRLDRDAAMSADLVGFYLPMHTATRLAGPVIRRVRELNARARLCAFGLYAPLNREWLRGLGVDQVLGGEFEQDLTALAGAVESPPDVSRPSIGGPARAAIRTNTSQGALPRLKFLVPDRCGLPSLDRYAALQLPDGSRRAAGYTEASRGCRHLCRHCPIVPVYGGQFRIVQTEVVLADIDAQVAAGAAHITFGDPDFLNGPTHALRIVEAMHARHPTITYDATIKVEHLRQHGDLLPRLRATGCAFVTSAVESVDDRVLQILDKGHTRADFVEAVQSCRAAGITLVPTFVAFHPWTTLDSYCDLLDTVAAVDLIGHVAPIQLAIRLLVPRASRLLEVPEMKRVTGAFDPETLTYRWTHPDERVDALQREISDLVGVRLAGDRHDVFDEIRALAYERAGRGAPESRPARNRSTVPYLNEPWYC